MLLILICLVSVYAEAHELINQIYEIEPAKSLECKAFEKLVDMTNVSCAVIASTESIYILCFVVQRETCMICRAGGGVGVWGGDVGCGVGVCVVCVCGVCVCVDIVEMSTPESTMSAH